MSDLFGIEGSHVLVTGGSSGLGRFFAAFLAARGARVTVGARRAEASRCAPATASLSPLTRAARTASRTRPASRRSSFGPARSLSRRRAEARDVLAAVYGWFTEGFDTADLKEAKTLLNELT